MREKNSPTFQLCWNCKKATGGCSWSDSFLPVDGWNAEQSFDSRGNEYSYAVKECPDFVEGDILNDKDKSIDKDGAKIVCAHIIKSAIESWEGLQATFNYKEYMKEKNKRTYSRKYDKIQNAMYSEFVQLVIFFNSELCDLALCTLGCDDGLNFLKRKYNIPYINSKNEIIYAKDLRKENKY